MNKSILLLLAVFGVLCLIKLSSCGLITEEEHGSKLRMVRSADSNDLSAVDDDDDDDDDDHDDGDDEDSKTTEAQKQPSTTPSPKDKSDKGKHHGGKHNDHKHHEHKHHDHKHHKHHDHKNKDSDDIKFKECHDYLKNFDKKHHKHGHHGHHGHKHHHHHKDQFPECKVPSSQNKTNEKIKIEFDSSKYNSSLSCMISTLLKHAEIGANKFNLNLTDLSISLSFAADKGELRVARGKLGSNFEFKITKVTKDDSKKSDKNSRSKKGKNRD